MNLISVNDLGVTAGSSLLFSGLSFGIDHDSRIAVLGRNGCGKSSLLRQIAGGDSGNGTYTEGEISRNREVKISFLEQVPVFPDDWSIADFIIAGKSQELDLVRRYESALLDRGGGDSSELAGIMAEMDRLDCWTLENRIHSLLSELGIADLNRKMAELSGGMIKKAALARALVPESNLIILDEPTNHLDIDTIRWLEEYLNGCGKALLLVTHDRYFMESVCNRIMEIENGSVSFFNGGYNSYLEVKAEQAAAGERQEARLKNIIRNEMEWINRGPRARAGKDRKRKERFFELNESLPQKSQASAGFSVESRRLGGKILDLNDVSKGYESGPLIGGFSYSFKKGDKIGILGANGSGKTTLLNLIAGRTEPDSGNIETGVNTRIAYYDQMLHELPDDLRAVDYITETAVVIKLSDGSSLSPAAFLERFLFSRTQQYTEIGRMSGGERKKLYLLKLLLENPNFLILDEPTNDFDIQTLSILEDFLKNFDGCLTVVSHDRFFLDRTTDFLFLLDGKGGVSGYSGDVSDYYANRISAEVTGTERKQGKKDVNRQKKGLSFKEKKELEGIEDQIMNLEDKKEELESFFISERASSEEAGAKKKEYRMLLEEIEKKYERWNFLESMMQD